MTEIHEPGGGGGGTSFHSKDHIVAFYSSANSFFEKDFFLFILCAWVLCLRMSRHHEHAARRGQKRAWEPLGLEL